MYISPNPASEIFYVELSDHFIDGKLTIYNALGKIITNQDVNNKSTSIDTEALHNGVYLIVVQKDNLIVSQRLVVNKV